VHFYGDNKSKAGQVNDEGALAQEAWGVRLFYDSDVNYKEGSGMSDGKNNFPVFNINLFIFVIFKPNWNWSSKFILLINFNLKSIIYY
jgi:hypothetical protein